MIRKVLRWIRCHRKTALGLFVLFAFLLLNLVAYRHAWAMTHFVAEGTATVKPESLSLLGKARVLFSGMTIPRPSAGDITPESAGLPFETHSIQGNNGVNLQAWYIPCPRSNGLVLMFHGYAACKVALLPEARVLHELGYALLLVDFQGSGGSSGSVTTIGFGEADDVALAMDHARARWREQPLILYGASMGSVAILRAVAIQRVRPQAVIMECPFDRLVNTVANRFAAMGMPSFPCAQLLVFWGGVQHGFDGLEHNPMAYATRVDCPVLQMHGGLDRRVTREQAGAIFTALAGPKEFQRFASAGHESYLAREPDKWRAVVTSFLSQYGFAQSTASAQKSNRLPLRELEDAVVAVLLERMGRLHTGVDRQRHQPQRQ
jgi:uncharacterized protein